MEHLLPVLSDKAVAQDQAGCDCSRRDFLRTACAPAVLTVLGMSLASCDSQDPLNGGGGGGGTGGAGPEEGITITGNAITVDLTKSTGSKLASEGGFLYFDGAHVIAANIDGSSVRAFSSICTHQGSAVSTFSGGRFLCSNRASGHGSQYDTSGEPVAGPAPAALREHAVTRDGNIVTISRG